jgi:hypothetical protein
MIATSITYDLVFLAHIIAAVDTLIVFFAMRSSAQAIARGADSAVQRAKFPNRRNWAARVIHVLPITGLILSLSGDSSVSLSKPWAYSATWRWPAASKRGRCPKNERWPK